MTVIGYVRGRRMRVYTGAWRLKLPAPHHGDNGRHRYEEWPPDVVAESRQNRHHLPS